MDTLTEEQYDKIFERNEIPISSLDLYHCEIPLLDIVPYVFAKQYYDAMLDDHRKSVKYCHIIMIKDNRFKHVDCRVGDKFQNPKIITNEETPESKLFVFKLEQGIDELSLYCYGIGEGDNVTSTIFITGFGCGYCKKSLGFGINRYVKSRFGQRGKDIVLANPDNVDFIFNPWISERTDVFVFHERMMIRHQVVRQEINEVYFDHLPLGYTAVLIQSTDNEKILIQVIKANGENPQNGMTFLTY